MKTERILTLVIVSCALGHASTDKSTKAAGNLPAVKTEARNLRRYSILRIGLGTADFALELRRANDPHIEAFLIDNAHDSDRILSIDGVDVSTLRTWQQVNKALHGVNKLVLLRKGGLRLEVDCYWN